MGGFYELLRQVLVGGMTCAACSGAVEKALLKLPGAYLLIRLLLFQYLETSLFLSHFGVSPLIWLLKGATPKADILDEEAFRVCKGKIVHLWGLLLC
jgi:hypothetical protein